MYLPLHHVYCYSYQKNLAKSNAPGSIEVEVAEVT